MVRGRKVRRSFLPSVTIIVVLVSMFQACRDHEEAVALDPAPIRLQVVRLDSILFHTDDLNAASRMAQAEARNLYPYYVEQVLAIGPVDDPRLAIGLSRFVNEPDWIEVQRRIEEVFGDWEEEIEGLEEAFGRLHTAFPDSIIPQIVLYNAGFNYGIFPTDSSLGIGVEWFIGRDHPVVQALAPEQFPHYLKERMVPAMLVPSAVKGWLLVHYQADQRGMDLLERMVHRGKVLVLLEALLPTTERHLLFGYSPDQLAWCEANELNIWRELVSKELIYTKDDREIARLLSDGPFTHGFPRESPGNLGEWLGYNMVRSYLVAQERPSFQELFGSVESRTVLRTYKPR
ncbi:MAG: hypothetical protein KDB88_05600 [Flavobacteriales bacterium]|nr:hypothetical protein [Flavobacteriales bacterium]